MMDNVLERNIDAEDYIYDPERFMFKNLHSNEEGETDLTFFPYYDKFQENQVFSIKAYHMTFSTLVLLKVAAEKVNDSATEAGEFLFSEFLQYDDLNQLEIPSVNTDPFTSSNETIFNNIYNSNADVDGTFAGSVSFNLYFLYIEDLDKYVVVTQKYYEI